MRTLAGLSMSLILSAGCNPSTNTVESPIVSRDADNTWTSDAVQRGDIAAVKRRVLSEPTYLNSRDYVGDTPLLTAIGSDQIALVQFLLTHDADPNVTVDDGYTCLLTAVESDAQDSVSIVELLVKFGADIDAIGTNGWTPLHMAAARGHIDKARLLIDAGADVDKRTDIDASETPLMEAAYAGKPKTVRLLLDHGADASLRDTMRERTPLEIAIATSKGADPDVVRILKEENIEVDVNEMFADIDLPADQLDRMKQSIANVDMAQSYIDSSKAMAASGNHAEVIRILTEHTSGQ